MKFKRILIWVYYSKSSLSPSINEVFYYLIQKYFTNLYKNNNNNLKYNYYCKYIIKYFSI